MRRTTAVAAAAAVMLLAGCGTSTTRLGGGPSPQTYDGPMSLTPDSSEDATVLERSGAAGRALECEGRPYNGGGSNHAEGGPESVQSSPERALESWLDNEAWAFQVPDAGYRVAREEGNRVLLSYDVDGRTRLAFIAVDGVRDHREREGWGIESWAQCDPAELTASATEALGIGVWEDESGARVPVTRVRSYQGSAHCGWQDVTFLQLDADSEAGQYVRDLDGELTDRLRTTFDATAALPAGATDTGLRREGRQLWFGPDEDAAFLVSIVDPGDVERWPAAAGPVYCR